jgi:hypothetical protein
LILLNFQPILGSKKISTGAPKTGPIKQTTITAPEKQPEKQTVVPTPENQPVVPTPEKQPTLTAPTVTELEQQPSIGAPSIPGPQTQPVLPNPEKPSSRTVAPTKPSYKPPEQKPFSNVEAPSTSSTQTSTKTSNIPKPVVVVVPKTKPNQASSSNAEEKRAPPAPLRIPSEREGQVDFPQVPGARKKRLTHRETVDNLIFELPSPPIRPDTTAPNADLYNVFTQDIDLEAPPRFPKLHQLKPSTALNVDLTNQLNESLKRIGLEHHERELRVYHQLSHYQQNAHQLREYEIGRQRLSPGKKATLAQAQKVLLDEQQTLINRAYGESRLLPLDSKMRQEVERVYLADVERRNSKLRQVLQAEASRAFADEEKVLVSPEQQSLEKLIPDVRTYFEYMIRIKPQDADSPSTLSDKTMLNLALELPATTLTDTQINDHLESLIYIYGRRIPEADTLNMVAKLHLYYQIYKAALVNWQTRESYAPSMLPKLTQEAFVELWNANHHDWVTLWESKALVPWMEHAATNVLFTGILYNHELQQFLANPLTSHAQRDLETLKRLRKGVLEGANNARQHLKSWQETLRKRYLPNKLRWGILPEAIDEVSLTDLFTETNEAWKIRTQQEAAAAEEAARLEEEHRARIAAANQLPPPIVHPAGPTSPEIRTLKVQNAMLENTPILSVLNPTPEELAEKVLIESVILRAKKPIPEKQILNHLESMLLTYGRDIESNVLQMSVDYLNHYYRVYHTQERIVAFEHTQSEQKMMPGVVALEKLTLPHFQELLQRHEFQFEKLFKSGDLNDYLSPSEARLIRMAIQFNTDLAEFRRYPVLPEAKSASDTLRLYRVANETAKTEDLEALRQRFIPKVVYWKTIPSEIIYTNLITMFTETEQEAEARWERTGVAMDIEEE